MRRACASASRPTRRTRPARCSAAATGASPARSWRRCCRSFAGTSCRCRRCIRHSRSMEKSSMRSPAAAARSRAARPVTIGELTVLGEADGDYVLRVRCSKGTYIRTLCHDIGAALDCGGVMRRPAPDGGRRVSRGGCAHHGRAVCAAARGGAAPAPVGGQPLAGRAAGHC